MDIGRAGNRLTDSGELDIREKIKWISGGQVIGSRIQGIGYQLPRSTTERRSNWWNFFDLADGQNTAVNRASSRSNCLFLTTERVTKAIPVLYWPTAWLTL